MTVLVNPPPQLRIPEQFLKDPISREFFKQTNTILFQLYNRTGGDTDLIDEGQGLADDFNESITGINADEIAEDYQDDFIYRQATIEWNAVSKSNSYTMVGYDFVNAKSNAQITFPLFPDENDQIRVRNGDGTLIKLLGNGRNINGSTSGFLRKKGTAITFIYFINTNEWFAI